MRKILIIFTIILLTLSGCEKKNNIVEEVKEKEIDAEVIIEAIKPRYDYLCLFPQEITDNNYDSDVQYYAPYVMQAFNSEYMLRNNKEFKGDEDEYISLCATYFGLNEEDIKAFLKYQKLDSSLVADKNDRDIKLIYYTVEDNIYTALIGYKFNGILYDRMLVSFVFDGNNINILDKKLSNYEAILDFNNGHDAVYLFTNKQVIRTKDGLLDTQIDLNDFNLPSAMFITYRWETTGDISEDFNTLTIKSERAMSNVLVDIENKTVDISYLEKTPDDMEILGFDKANNQIARIISDFGGEGQFYDLWLIKNNKEKVFLTSSSGLAEAGFFMNGDAYVWDYKLFHIYKDGNCIYKFEDHFDLSDKLLFAIQKGEDCFYAVYASRDAKYLNDDPTKLDTTYKFVKVDYDGNVLQSTDTGINVMLHKHYYLLLNIRRDVNKNTMEINIEDKVRCTIDLDSFEIVETKIK